MCPTTSSELNTRRPQTTRSARWWQGGFTLAGLLIILTVLMVFVAYTVPRQWSQVMARERDRQTIFVMKQYARAIKEFQAKNNNTFPVSLDQLKDAKSPRFIRNAKGEYPDPLTGKVDWILMPPGTGTTTTQGPTGGNITPSGPAGSPTYVPGSDPRLNPSAQNPNLGGVTGPSRPGSSPKDYSGPFVGVRPNAQGKAFIALNGNDSYEQWSYTVQDLQNEINTRAAALAAAPH
jgi:type II secretory pathway pseudopilin PulG